MSWGKTFEMNSKIGNCSNQIYEEEEEDDDGDDDDDYYYIDVIASFLNV